MTVGAPCHRHAVTRERLITVTEACDLFGKSRAQIYRWISEHGIREVDRIPGRGHRVGRAVYRLSDFAAVAAERHAQKTSAANVASTAKA